jgi:hypothetical protein
MMFVASGVAVDHVDLTVRLVVSLDEIRSVLSEIAAEPLFGLLWPEDETLQSASATQNMRAKKVAESISAMRYRARQHCPGGLLPDFERDIRELDIAIRGALAQRYTARCAVDLLLASVERFGIRWQPYLDPPPSRPPRLRCDETDRSIWLDGRCVAPNLSKRQFEFVRAVAKASPDAISFRTLRNLLNCLRGANQARLKNELPPKLRELIEGGPTGYVLKLPPKLSASVEAT